MVASTTSTTLLAGLPETWMETFAQSLSSPNESIAALSSGSSPIVSNVRPITVAPGWTDAAEALARYQQDHPPVTTAVIASLSAPVATSLPDALTALETAVAENDLAPQQLLAALIQSMLLRQSGRILLVTYDPRSIPQPEDAAVRGSARGIFTYLESLRPALKRRGISAGMLLIAPVHRARWDMAASAKTMATAAADCLHNATLQRVVKVR